MSAGRRRFIVVGLIPYALAAAFVFGVQAPDLLDDPDSLGHMLRTVGVLLVVALLFYVPAVVACAFVVEAADTLWSWAEDLDDRNGRRVTRRRAVSCIVGLVIGFAVFGAILALVTRA